MWPARDIVATTLLLVQALSMTIYWAIYFGSGSPWSERWYLAFEDSFPLSDGFVVLTSVLCVMQRRFHAMLTTPGPAKYTASHSVALALAENRGSGWLAPRG